jgi:FtsP/CotA-like multicopper oxidase with cupredoxin domain
MTAPGRGDSHGGGGRGGRYHTTTVPRLRGGVGAALAFPWMASTQLASAGGRRAEDVSRTGAVAGRTDRRGVRDRADAAGQPDRAGFQGHGEGPPGQFTTIRARYDLPHGVTAPQTYVYHCHILEHEDNDMMRPSTVTA